MLLPHEGVQLQYAICLRFGMTGQFHVRCCRFMRYLPKMVKHAKEVFLTYIAPVHYNTIK